jgi:AbrB family looped-hinge helix DNA binding protein
MGITTVTKKGQITIPVKVREALSIKEKDKLIITVEGKRAVIQKTTSARDLLGSIKVDKAKQGASWEQIRKVSHFRRVKGEQNFSP